MGFLISIIEEVIRPSDQAVSFAIYDSLDSSQVGLTQMATLLHFYRFKPELGDLFIALHMHMRRFVAIVCVKEKTVRTFA